MSSSLRALCWLTDWLTCACAGVFGVFGVVVFVESMAETAAEETTNKLVSSAALSCTAPSDCRPQWTDNCYQRHYHHFLDSVDSRSTLIPLSLSLSFFFCATIFWALTADSSAELAYLFGGNSTRAMAHLRPQRSSKLLVNLHCF